MTNKKIWISAEAILDAITWSNMPKSFTDEQKRDFKAYHDGKLVAMECCDRLGVKHSYYFSANDVVEQVPDPNKLTFCIEA